MKVGIMGAGQLGLMLGQAGKSLDVEFAFLDPAENPPAQAIGPVLSRAFDSEEGLAMLAACDVVTYEFENVPAAAVDELARRVPVFPPPAALKHAQDRLREKQLFETLDIPVPEWRPVSSRRALEDAVREIGLPMVLKTRRLGYDGKGQAIIRREGDADDAWDRLGDRPLIAERLIRFDREVSVLGARSQDGRTTLYPITRNEHRGGILHVSRAPDGDGLVATRAAGHLQKLLSHLDYVGVLALEMFVVGEAVLANECAPRVHNSGHWTIEGARTSQFENHLRAILGLPLGDSSPFGYSGMINLIGSLPANTGPFTAPGHYLHDYGKRPRPGRKLGHLTIVAPDAAGLDHAISKALKVIGN